MKGLVTLVAAAFLLVAAACCSRSSESPGTSPGDPEAVGGAAGPNYSIEVRAPEKTAVGAEASAEIVVTPLNGYKINLEYPAKLVLESVPLGTKVESSTVTKAKMSVEQKRLGVPLRFTPEGPGEKRFSGELRFSVCNPQSCQMPRETVSFTTLAEGGAADAGTAEP